jgi:hypothetical protein
LPRTLLPPFCLDQSSCGPCFALQGLRSCGTTLRVWFAPRSIATRQSRSTAGARAHARVNYMSMSDHSAFESDEQRLWRAASSGAVRTRRSWLGLRSTEGHATSLGARAYAMPAWAYDHPDRHGTELGAGRGVRSATRQSTPAESGGKARWYGMARMLPFSICRAEERIITGTNPPLKSLAAPPNDSVCFAMIFSS